jgi:hypothetical protein
MSNTQPVHKIGLKMSEQSVAVARIIVGQIGGNMALAMIGAYQVVAIENGVRIKFRAKAKEINGHRPNVIEIHLDPIDTYTLKLFRLDTSNSMYLELYSLSDVYCDQLKPIIEKETCLYLSL